jgi:hypothetical protein
MTQDLVSWNKAAIEQAQKLVKSGARCAAAMEDQRKTCPPLSLEDGKRQQRQIEWTGGTADEMQRRTSKYYLMRKPRPACLCQF